ncbi:MAG: Gfo/Idh/MocA family oxidoreductase [Anaerolineae bacterium]
MTKPLEMALLGAGNRGYYAYAPYALAYPEQLKFVAVAEPDDVKRERFAKAHGIPAERQFASWEDLLAQPQLAEAVLNCTMDRDHIASSLAALNAGYDMLLEKPMAATAGECVQIVQAAERTGRLVQVCHVLRYGPFFSTLAHIVQSGRLGEIVSVNHNENLSYLHMAHSFVRGNWGNAERSAPMILAKCCHDLDYLTWLMGSPATTLSSVGTTQVFRSDRVGPEIPARCLDGCPIEETCGYYAPRVYLGETINFMRKAISPDTSYEARLHALQTGPYGRCVYRCDNTVVDHQVVSMMFPSGASVTLTMQGFSNVEGRTTRIDGTRATLHADEPSNEILIYDHPALDASSHLVEVIRPVIPESGHGGGDFSLMSAFIKTIRDGEPALTTARVSLESHLMAFAAEEARLNRTVVVMDEYRARVEREALALA